MRMSTIGKTVRLLREEKGWNVRQLAEKVGMSYASLASKERGETRIKPPDRKKLAKALGKSLEEFDRLWRATAVHDRPAPTQIPVINRGPAGRVMAYDHSQSSGGEYHDAMQYLDRSERTQHSLAFALIVVGDSMEPTFFADDYLVFVPVFRAPGTTEVLEPGAVVFCRVSAASDTGEGVALGRYQPIGGENGKTFMLTKDNPRHKAITLRREHVEQMAIAIEIRTNKGLR